MVELEFERGEASLATLKQQTEAILKSLGEAEGRAELEAAGFDPSVLSDATFAFDTREAGVLGVGETVIVSVAASHVIAPVAKKVLLDLWKVVVLPRIRRRFGEDAVGNAREPATGTAVTRKKKKVRAAEPKKAASTGKKAKPSGGKTA
jgi:hypothetical protein